MMNVTTVTSETSETSETSGRTRTQTMRTLQTHAVVQPKMRDRARAAIGAITGLGRAVITLAVVTWIAATQLGWDELAAIAAGLLILTVLCAVFALGRLDVSSTIGISGQRFVVGGADARGQLEVVNRRKRAIRNVRIELPIGHRIAVFPVRRLAGDDTGLYDFDLPTDRRTVLPVGPVTTVQGDPLGLFRRTRSWSDIEDVFIHPQTVRLPSLAAGLVRDMEGQPTLELSPSDVAFHALRDYVPGDDRRHIHWRSSARLGTLLVRQYIDTRRSHIAIAISADLDEYASDDEFELAISAAGSTALQAIHDGQTLTILVGNVEIPTDNPVRMLDHFSAIQPQDVLGSLASSVVALKTKAPGASVAVACVGSSLDIVGLRRATAWVHGEIATVVLQASLGGQQGYQLLDTTAVIRVPELDRLAVDMQAVSW